MKFLNKAIMLIALAAQPAIAKEPSVVFLGPAGNEAPTAMLGFEDAHTQPLSNCQQIIAEVTVSEIAYNGPSEIIAGFRVDPENAANGVTLYRFGSANDITTEGARQLRKIVRKGAQLIVLGQTCGMGRLTTVRELWLKSAINQ